MQIFRIFFFELFVEKGHVQRCFHSLKPRLTESIEVAQCKLFAQMVPHRLNVKN